jgi:hypothetical protein
MTTLIPAYNHYKCFLFSSLKAVRSTHLTLIVGQLHCLGKEAPVNRRHRWRPTNSCHGFHESKRQRRDRGAP